MPIYKVEVKEVYVQTYYIKTISPQTARNNAVDGGEIDEGDFVYSHTLDPKEWCVTKIDN